MKTSSYVNEAEAHAVVLLVQVHIHIHSYHIQQWQFLDSSYAAGYVLVNIINIFSLFAYIWLTSSATASVSKHDSSAHWHYYTLQTTAHLADRTVAKSDSKQRTGSEHCRWVPGQRKGISEEI